MSYQGYTIIFTENKDIKVNEHSEESLNKMFIRDLIPIAKSYGLNVNANRAQKTKPMLIKEILKAKHNNVKPKAIQKIELPKGPHTLESLGKMQLKILRKIAKSMSIASSTGGKKKHKDILINEIIAGEKNNTNRKFHCEVDNCLERCKYGPKNSEKKRCINHKKDTDLDLTRTYCKEESCTKRSTYGSDGLILYCSDHRKDGDIDNVHKRCIYEGCNLIPSFGLKGSPAIHCMSHKEENEISKGKKCEYQDCKTSARYAIEGQTKKHCSKHREENEVDVVSRRCIHKNCMTIPIFGLEYQIPIHCSQHKDKKEIDLVNSKCIYDGCTKNPSYGLPGTNKRIHCFTHRDTNECNVMLQYCEFNDCERIAYYSDKLGVRNAKRCFTHKFKEDIHCHSKKCNSCNLYYLGDYEVCYYCNPNRNRKVKEIRIIELFKNTNFMIDFKYNSKVDKYYPDVLFDCSDHYVIVEVDEDQHKSSKYDSNCELQRMYDIFEWLKLPCIFIRYNPDVYRINDEIQNISDETRHETLIKTVKEYINNKPNIPFEVKYLYYNDILVS